MKFSEIKEIDSTIELVHPESWDEEIEGLTGIESPRPKHLLFLKDAVFLKKMIQAFEKEQSKIAIYQSMGVIVDKVYYQSMKKSNESSWNKLVSSIGFVATSDNIPLSMSRLSYSFYQKKIGNLNDLEDGRKLQTVTIHPEASIAEGVFLGDNVKIGRAKIHAGCRILAHSTIGDDTVLYPNVTVYHYVSIGNRCRIHSNSVIGADGFGYNFHNGEHLKVWHMGGVVLHDNVEIGANSAVDAGTFSPTVIGAGTKLDNHVQIGHNCHLGRGTIFCGHTAVGGSSTVGDFTVFGGKSGMGDGMTIGSQCQVAGGALVNHDWPDGSILAGHPARPVKEWLKGVAYLRKESLKKNI